MLELEDILPQHCRLTEHPPMYWTVSPNLLMIYPTVLNILQNTDDILPQYWTSVLLHPTVLELGCILLQNCWHPPQYWTSSTVLDDILSQHWTSHFTGWYPPYILITDNILHFYTGHPPHVQCTVVTQGDIQVSFTSCQVGDTVKHDFYWKGRHSDEG